MLNLSLPHLIYRGTEHCFESHKSGSTSTLIGWVLTSQLRGPPDTAKQANRGLMKAIIKCTSNEPCAVSRPEGQRRENS